MYKHIVSLLIVVALSFPFSSLAQTQSSVADLEKEVNGLLKQIEEIDKQAELLDKCDSGEKLTAKEKKECANFSKKLKNTKGAGRNSGKAGNDGKSKSKSSLISKVTAPIKKALKGILGLLNGKDGGALSNLLNQGLDQGLGGGCSGGVCLGLGNGMTQPDLGQFGGASSLSNIPTASMCIVSNPNFAGEVDSTSLIECNCPASPTPQTAGVAVVANGSAQGLKNVGTSTFFKLTNGLPLFFDKDKSKVQKNLIAASAGVTEFNIADLVKAKLVLGGCEVTPESGVCRYSTVKSASGAVDCSQAQEVKGYLVRVLERDRPVISKPVLYSDPSRCPACKQLEDQMAHAYDAYFTRGNGNPPGGYIPILVKNGQPVTSAGDIQGILQGLDQAKREQTANQMQ